MQPIILTLRILDDFDNPTQSIWVARTSPQCAMCDSGMDFVGYTRFHDEIWCCQLCAHVDTYYGDYGFEEVEVSEAEAEAYRSEQRVKSLLKKRYGTTEPKSIRDYWRVGDETR